MSAETERLSSYITVGNLLVADVMVVLQLRTYAKHGRSGLGLEAQQAAIKTFCAQHGYKIEAEYREVETGKGADALERRPELAAAMK